MENVVDLIGDVLKRRGGDDGFAGNAVAAHGQGVDGGEVGGSDQGGVTVELHQLPRANENRPEFQDGEPLPGSRRHRRLHVEEGYFEPVLAPTRHLFIFSGSRVL